MLEITIIEVLHAIIDVKCSESWIDCWSDNLIKPFELNDFETFFEVTIKLSIGIEHFRKDQNIKTLILKISIIAKYLYCVIIKIWENISISRITS